MTDAAPPPPPMFTYTGAAPVDLGQWTPTGLMTPEGAELFTPLTGTPAVDPGPDFAAYAGPTVASTAPTTPPPLEPPPVPDVAGGDILPTPTDTPTEPAEIPVDEPQPPQPAEASVAQPSAAEPVSTTPATPTAPAAVIPTDGFHDTREAQAALEHGLPTSAGWPLHAQAVEILGELRKSTAAMRSWLDWIETKVAQAEKIGARPTG